MMKENVNTQNHNETQNNGTEVTLFNILNDSSGF